MVLKIQIIQKLQRSLDLDFFWTQLFVQISNNISRCRQKVLSLSNISRNRNIASVFLNNRVCKEIHIDVLPNIPLQTLHKSIVFLH